MHAAVILASFSRAWSFAPGLHLRTNYGVSQTLPPSDPRDHSPRRTSASNTGLNMFMGSDGGILGVGGPEIVSSPRLLRRPWLAFAFL